MPKVKVERKITKIGNSLGLTLPQEVLEHIAVKQGDEVSFQFEDGGKVSIKKNVSLDFDGLEGIDQDFLDGMKELFTDYDKTLKNLVDR